MEGKPRSSAMLGESGFERLADDAYFTEPWVTRALIDTALIRGPVWEPSCGRGDMVGELVCNDVTVGEWSDIRDYGYFATTVRSFLTFTEMPEECVSIVTNPPYANGGEFVAHAIDLTRATKGQVWMLLRHEFDCAATRRRLFLHRAFACKLVLTRRPRWDWWTDKPSKASPRHNFAWFGWDWLHEGPPILRYAP